MNKHDVPQSEEKFRTLFDKMTLGVFYQNSDGSLVDVNPAALTMFGLTREQFLGRDSYDPHWKVVSEDGAILPAERHPSMIALRTGMPVNNVILGVHNPVRNDYTWVNINATPLFRPGEVIPYQAFVTMGDITERKQAEASLRESERKFREIFNKANDAIHLHEIEKDGRPGKYIDVNEVACQMVQYSRDEMLQHAPLDFTTDYHSPSLEKILEELRTVGNAIFETGHIRKDGTIVPVEINAHVISLSGRNVVLSVVRDITERKRAEDVLRESEKQYRTLLDQVPELILVQRNGIILYVNPAAEKTLKYTREEALNRPVSDFIAPEYLSRVAAAIPHRMNGEAVEPYEIEIVGKDGSRRTVIISGSRTEFEGTPASLIVLTDITERKRAENSLQKSEQQYRTLLDQVPELILVHQKGIVKYVNPVVLKTLGYHPEEALNRPLTDFVAPEYHAPVEAAVRRRIIGEAVEPYEIEIVGKDGGRRTVIISGSRIEFEGTPASLIVLTDITERKRVENSLKKSEQQYRTLLDQVPELILVHQKGIIKYVNPVALKTLGYTPEEALNRPVSDFIAPEYLSRVAAALRQRPVGETVDPYEIEILAKEGGRRTVIVSGSLIEFEGTTASLNVLTDITDRKALEVAVQQANRKLNLLSSITRHDIINQLTLLIGYIAISRRYLDDKKILTTFLDKEEKAATIIERQIRFTKEYQDVGVAAPTWQNVSASVTQAVAELPVRAVRVEVDKHDLEIFADPLFEKVFYNLIDNALRYGGKEMTTIRVSSQESDTCLTILCEDNGAGITDEDKKRLFSKGFGKNTGLGLFLTREILAITGITIAENGTPGKGARFEITVPKGAYRFRGKG